MLLFSLSLVDVPFFISLFLLRENFNYNSHYNHHTKGGMRRQHHQKKRYEKAAAPSTWRMQFSTEEGWDSSTTQSSTAQKGRGRKAARPNRMRPWAGAAISLFPFGWFCFLPVFFGTREGGERKGGGCWEVLIARLLSLGCWCFLLSPCGLCCLSPSFFGWCHLPQVILALCFSTCYKKKEKHLIAFLILFVVNRDILQHSEELVSLLGMTVQHLHPNCKYCVQELVSVTLDMSTQG